MLIFLFLLHSSVIHRDIRSFPTRRSSDLARRARGPAALRGGFRMSADGGAPDRPARGGPLPAASASRGRPRIAGDRKSTRLNSSHVAISYAVFCLKKKTEKHPIQ